MLSKRLSLGGLELTAPKTTPSAQRFTTARNVYMTRNNYLVPKKETVVDPDFATAAPDGTIVLCAGRFRNEEFILFSGVPTNIPSSYGVSSKLLNIYWKGEIYPVLGNVQGGDLVTVSSMSCQYISRTNILYILFSTVNTSNPNLGDFRNNVLVFDGFQLRRAGTILPYLSSTNLSDSGTVYIRGINHTIDLEGNVYNSGYVQFLTAPVGGNVQLIGADINPSFTTYSPRFRTVENISNDNSPINTGQFKWDEWSFISTGSAVIFADRYEIPISPIGSNQAIIGQYILIDRMFRSDYTTSSGTINALAVALKIVDFDTGTNILTLSRNEAKLFVTNSQSWETFDGFNYVLTPITSMKGTNNWTSIWTSNTVNGNYVLKAILAAPNFTTESFLLDVTAPTVASVGLRDNVFNLPLNLGDNYDVATVKDPLPINPIAMTTYTGLMIFAYPNTIYFSDPTLGGSDPIVNALSFENPGEDDYGDFVAVCGTEDFLFVARERRNYFITGNLVTNNFRVQEITDTEIGPYSSTSCMAIKNGVVFINQQGVWALSSGGQAKEVSIRIRDMFNQFSGTLQSPDSPLWTMPLPVSSSISQWLRMKYDEVRELLFFLTPNGRALVLDTLRGEFFEWDTLATVYSDVECIGGNYLIAIGGLTEGDADLRVEDKTLPGRAVLKSTWFNSDEPSIEKKGLQLKIFGYIGGTVNIKEYRDWAATIWSDVNYVSNGTYNHKKRLDSSVFLSQSIELQNTIDTVSVDFQIEGMEVEFNPIQEGMKK